MSMQDLSNESALGHLPKERQQFSALLLGNPNYFGNLEGSGFEAVQAMQGNTSYEELGCVGFQPQQSQLEAVVYLKQKSGYGGPLCSSGSTEYVRFYLSEDNGRTWQDLGLSKFTAYNQPSTEGNTLAYAVTLKIDPHRQICSTPQMPKVRAILSWQVAPPPNMPQFQPVWGHAHDTTIQVEPRRWIVLGDIFKDAGVKVPAALGSSIDLSQKIPAMMPTLSLAELHQSYQGKVEPHRFALPEIKEYLLAPTLPLGPLADGPASLSSPLEGLALDIDPDVISALLHPTDGNTSYERLNCIGLAPHTDTFVGILRVNKPQGYSGSLCTAGSQEFVTFWADFDNNGSFETCLGTASVKVHDIEKLPKGGLDYAVRLPFDLSKYRQPCQKGPRYVKIRAILSWQTAPPSNNPDYVPVWGNRLEATVLLESGQTELGHTPVIQHVGNVLVSDIHPVSGLATGSETYFTVQNSPFGGLIWIAGKIANASSALKYKVMVSQDKVNWETLTNTFQIDLGSFVHVLQSADANGYYTYNPNETLGQLALWETAPKEGIWYIHIQVKDESTSPPTFYEGQEVTVCLDNTVPNISDFKINMGGGDCADFMIGDPISGDYSVSDTHFASVSVRLLPAKGGPANAPTVSNAAAPSGTWTLNTKGLPRCGYAVELVAYDRTIVNSVMVGWSNSKAVGLCLREPTKPK